MKEVEERLGPIDRVYSAAAIMPTGLLMEQDTETIVRVMEVDYNGLVHVAKAILPGMLERGRGDLINFASIAGWGPTLHFGAYNAAKFAVVAFSEVLYHENRGRGVRIIAVCPPPVDTPLLDQATSKPKVLEQGGKPIEPGRVLDAIERDLAKGKPFCFPTAQTKLAQVSPAPHARADVVVGAPDRRPLADTARTARSQLMVHAGIAASCCLSDTAASKSRNLLFSIRSSNPARRNR